MATKQQMDNMKVWNALKTPPASALKKIGGGRLKGMTDINPQWRYQIMTEQFGMCGEGWKYDIVRTWSENGSDGQIFAFAEIKLYTRLTTEDMWSDSIPGVGGSMLVEKESKGLHSSDEGYKMAITDALSVAMKMIGVAADVYMGLSDSKYKDKPTTKDNPKAAPKMTMDDWDAVQKIGYNFGMDDEKIKEVVKWKCSKENINVSDTKILEYFTPYSAFDKTLGEYREGGTP